MEELKALLTKNGCDFEALSDIKAEYGVTLPSGDRIVITIEEID